jgi:hypothetical protein
MLASEQQLTREERSVTRNRRPKQGRPSKSARLADAPLTALEELPNVGPAVARYLRRAGVGCPQDLLGQDPYALFDGLCRRTGQRFDPCLLDTFIAAVRFMAGEPAKPWWAYTAERKRELARRAAEGPV